MDDVEDAICEVLELADLEPCILSGDKRVELAKEIAARLRKDPNVLGLRRKR